VIYYEFGQALTLFDGVGGLSLGLLRYWLRLPGVPGFGLFFILLFCCLGMSRFSVFMFLCVCVMGYFCQSAVG